jgi:ankyrin repeat protein
LFGRPVVAAAYAGDADIIVLLLQAKADVKLTGGLFGSALHAAAFRGHADVLELLIGMDANVKANVGSFGSVLSAALVGQSQSQDRNNLKRVVKMFLDAGADPNGNANGCATTDNTMTNKEEENEEKRRSPLRLAAGHQRRDIVELLLDTGADVEQSWSPFDLGFEDLQAAKADGRGTLVEAILVAGGSELRSECGISSVNSHELL